MSDRPSPPKFEGYQPIDVNQLRENSTLDFDCHIFLPANGKLIRWLRAGTVFGQEQVKKLEKLGQNQVLVPEDQLPAMQAYIGLKEKKSGSDLIHIKGTPPEKQSIRIFGRTIVNEPEAADIGSVAVQEKDPSATAAKPKMQVDAGFINATISAIQHVFLNICKTSVNFKTPTKRTASSTVPFPVNIASFVDLNSGTIRGAVGLCFPATTYLNLLSAATGLKYTQLSDNVALGAGEFMCHIFQTVRPGLAKLGYEVDKAVPFLVMGDDIPVRHVLPQNGFSFLINSDFGPFQFEVGISTGG